MTLKWLVTVRTTSLGPGGSTGTLAPYGFLVGAGDGVAACEAVTPGANNKSATASAVTLLIFNSSLNSHLQNTGPLLLLTHWRERALQDTNLLLDQELAGYHSPGTLP